MLISSSETSPNFMGAFSATREKEMNNMKKGIIWAFPMDKIAL
jgi:hypothetical protein